MMNANTSSGTVPGLNARIVSDNEMSHAEMPATHKVSKNDRFNKWLWGTGMPKKNGQSSKTRDDYNRFDSDVDSVMIEKERNNESK